MRLEHLFYQVPGSGRFELGPLSLEGPDDRPWLVIGPAGCGKTTLLRLLGGVLEPHSGTIAGIPPGEEKAYLPQLPERALAGRSVAEDLSGDLRPNRAMRADLRRVLELVGLAGVSLAAHSRELSAGERRRLSLALLHLGRSRHWALDEPDAGLDEPGKRHLLNWLGFQKGRRLWIATHRWEVYRDLHPWTIALTRGGLAGWGDLSQVLATAEVQVALDLEPGVVSDG